MKPRTSESHPLQIVFVETPGHGRIGMTFCPGKHDPRAKTGPWSRDMHTDIAAIADWGAVALITLVESRELDLLGVSGLGDAVLAQGMGWYPERCQSASADPVWTGIPRHVRALRKSDELTL